MYDAHREPLQLLLTRQPGMYQSYFVAAARRSREDDERAWQQQGHY
ncbi:hypothetical protein I305_02191 [Cryptococcus gattii E566]|uniref:Uncharacterized protein n=2 Tax=Cryptococcus gattii TaxID=37769 RepID=E6RDH5_CRYGW|nr:Hypothetical Protein CGB_K1800C [Cryptococcus gattii WM276]ADV25092.1 Hypothetical Protein CGB_K1800C [Cryptococcus gattii WM276]KIR79211.1 hypothetical protein I306_03772 [Cryptococcus gattii EJB2]KIY35285.1 hypothetical protein I305_02191 [Cryptococcus gattii E566]KJE05749.1 hypothetical protein I311_00474 [Cryptococcus gattii NT-10]